MPLKVGAHCQHYINIVDLGLHYENVNGIS